VADAAAEPSSSGGGGGGGGERVGDATAAGSGSGSGGGGGAGSGGSDGAVKALADDAAGDGEYRLKSPRPSTTLVCALSFFAADPDGAAGGASVAVAA
jgi:hypothetical protein